MTLPYVLTNDTLTIMLGSETFLLRQGAKHWEAARRAVMAEDWKVLQSLVSPGRAIQQWLGEGWTFKDNLLFYGGDRIDERLNERLLKMVEDDESPLPWMNFWKRLQQNPSYRSVQQLYAFLMHGGIPIDAEGYLLAYKSVTRDYRDHHTKTVDNTPGQTPEMPRNRISDDPNMPCHEGFHVGALKYAQSFGGGEKRIVICRVDPADVVCVPYDSSAMKVRVCRYHVLGNYSGSPLPNTTFTEDPEPDVETTFTEDPESDDPEPDVERDARDSEYTDQIHKAHDCIASKLIEDDLWDSFKAMSRDELNKLSMNQLRRFAALGLQIVGASKLPGGKTALIDRILEILKP